MAKKRVGVSAKVREFCKKLDSKLSAEFWGDIDPVVFKYLKDGDLSDSGYDLGLMNEILEDIL